NCVEQMSDTRERNKAELLRHLLDKHSMLLAFDSRPISLALINNLSGDKTRTILAWGSETKGRDAILEQFARGSSFKGVIGLCSDSLAEGVNLQQASCMVHSDMPSVVRIAEQRA